MATTTGTAKLPSSMTGPPVSALVPPGQCQFGPDWTAVPLLERFPVTQTTSVMRFGLPDPTKPLQLSTCACILANDVIDGEDVTRPYTPISTNADVGHFDLLIKHYGPTAKMSRRMHEIAVGECIRFKHIEFNVKIQAPFGNDRICMLAGGTGIAPLIQALHAILGANNTDATQNTKVTILYGSKFADDILGQELLDKWAADYPECLEVIDVLSDEPVDTAWKGTRGYINKAMVERYFPPPSANPLIFVCGPPPMYNALSGPREEKEVKGLLGEMGYQTQHVYKF